MTTERLALLPLTGAGERTCDGCQACLPVETGSGAECGMHGDGIRPHELLTKQGMYLRLPQCLSAERDAARLRAVEGAARAYFAADDALAEKMQESEHWRDIDAESARAGEALLALRAALKE